MNKVLIIALLLCAVYADTWNVIVAGSYQYKNYRHQADACHNYQILKKNGIPEDHIILFMYDDVAYAEENPFKGHLYNQVGEDPEDVYEGCKPSYTGKTITPEVYLAVLLGDAQTVTNLTGIENPPVLRSTKDDLVFLSFFDHGSEFVVGFPDDHLHADDLEETFEKMHAKNSYKKLVYYMESCQSGSMFENFLPSNLSIYTATPTHGYEPSWGYYCEGYTKGVYMETCMGDLFACNWMERADQHLEDETLYSHFQFILKNVTKSHPQQYGDLTFLNDSLWDYLGDNKGIKKISPITTSHLRNNKRQQQQLQVPVESSTATIKYLHNKLSHAKTAEEKQKAKMMIEAEEEMRREINVKFTKIVMKLNYENYGAMKKVKQPAHLRHCYYKAIDAYRDYCGFNEYAFNYYYTMMNLCSFEYGNADRIVDAIKTVCKKN